MRSVRVLAAAILVPLACISPSAARAVIERPLPMVSVSGEATVSVAPDLATAVAGVSSEGKTPREAAEANGRSMSTVLGALKQAGIPDADVRTMRFGISPVYSQRREGTPQIAGYRVSNQVQVKIRDLDKVADVLDRMIGAGANTVGNVDFSVADPSKLLDEARNAAFADARRKAELYARAAGAQVGRVVSVVEQGAAPPRPMALRMSEAAMPAATTPIAAGEETLRVHISVSFELNN
jgi:uncharacterized protein YggE